MHVTLFLDTEKHLKQQMMKYLPESHYMYFDGVEQNGSDCMLEVVKYFALCMAATLVPYRSHLG